MTFWISTCQSFKEMMYECFIFAFLLCNLGRSGNSDLFYFLGFQNPFAWWLQPWNSKMFIPWRESYDKPRKIKKGKESKIVSHSVLSNCMQPHGPQSARRFCWWDFLDKSSAVGCHFLLQGIFQNTRDQICISLCLLH